jgi:hypothetical protein
MGTWVPKSCARAWPCRALPSPVRMAPLLAKQRYGQLPTRGAEAAWR